MSHDEKIEEDPRENDTSEPSMGTRLAELFREENTEKYVPNVTPGRLFTHTIYNRIGKHPLSLYPLRMYPLGI